MWWGNKLDILCLNMGSSTGGGAFCFPVISIAFPNTFSFTFRTHTSPIIGWLTFIPLWKTSDNYHLPMNLYYGGQGSKLYIIWLISLGLYIKGNWKGDISTLSVPSSVASSLLSTGEGLVCGRFLQEAISSTVNEVNGIITSIKRKGRFVEIKKFISLY